MSAMIRRTLDKTTVWPQMSMNGEKPAEADLLWIRRSTRIKGHIRGKVSLMIDGTIEGSVDVGDNTVTVGKGGLVSADVIARAVIVRGRVTGDITADRVEIVPSGQVQGDIRAQRISLADGATFNGSVNGKPGASGKIVSFPAV